MSTLPGTTLGTELLDNPAADPAMVRDSLHSIARANRWFGGLAAVHFGLGRALSQTPRGSRLTLVDVGTGLGDLPRAAVRWAARRGWTIAPAGVELNQAAARCAQDLGLPTVVACGGSLPMRDRSVDVLLVSQVIHHLSGDAALALLRECDRVARRAVIISDLQRHPLALAGFWVGSWMLGFDAATRMDGMTSVRRGYSRAEFAALFRLAGLPAATFIRPGFRLVGIWKPVG